MPGKLASPEKWENLAPISLTVRRHAEAACPGTHGSHVRVVLLALVVIGPGGALFVVVLTCLVCDGENKC